MSRRVTSLAVSAVAVFAVACSSGPAASPGAPASSAPSRSTVASRTAGHVVVVVLENKPYATVIGNRHAPYLNALARQGTSYTAMYAIRHPSQPNYIALFSGRTHGVHDDSCPQHLGGPTLAGQLRRAGRSFVGYSEGLPKTGSKACRVSAYARKHAPWTNFAALPKSVNQPLTAFPRNYAKLPTVAWVIPDLDHDMHDGTITQADTWVRRHLGHYATWARTHHSVLVVTWDEDDHSAANRIPTFVVGSGVPARVVGRKVTLYSLLRGIEDRYHLHRLGAAASAPPLRLT